jgi:hypothetical protein
LENRDLTKGVRASGYEECNARLAPTPHRLGRNWRRTQVREACGAGMHMVNGACITTSARRHVRRGVATGHGKI